MRFCDHSGYIAKSPQRKFRRKLTPELSKRYGSKGPYTRAQVETTIRELRLNDKYIRYTYLMFCEQEQISESAILKMQDAVAATVGDGGEFGDG